MNSVIRPRPDLWERCGDDEPTRVMQPQQPPSLFPVALPPREPVAASATPPRRSQGSKLAFGALGVGLALGLGALVLPQFAQVVELAKAGRTFVASSSVEVAAATAATAQLTAAPAQLTAAPEIDPADRADAALDRASFNTVSGVQIAIPSTFASSDGAYDLVIHFHGLNKLVAESFEHAGLNAIVVVVNLGTGSASYSSHFSSQAALTSILDKVQTTLEKRGLRGARLRRVALSAFSAGYGAARAVLGQPALADQVDAVLLLDGIHTGYQPRDHSLDVERLMPFERFAEQALSGKKLFSITHSEITPNAEYASTHESTDAVLALLGVARGPGGEAPAIPEIPALANVGKLVPLAPLSEAHQGALHVRGYDGTQKADHMMHLAQMSETAVPDLVQFWSGSPAS
jgi:hypothetical protein